MTIEGHDGVRGFYDSFGMGNRGSFSSIKLEVTHQHVSSETITVEVILTGAHTAEFQGIPATGRSVEIPVCAVFLFDNEGKIAGERVYFDGSLVLRQLGVLG
jgi:steroid delta-isomerase-like uncharacterized protein